MNRLRSGTLFKISPKRKFGLIKTGSNLISFSFENVAADDRAFIEIGDALTFVIQNSGYREIAIDVCKDSDMEVLSKFMI